MRRRDGDGHQVVPRRPSCVLPSQWSDSREIVAHIQFWTVTVELEKLCMRRNGQIRCQRCAGCLVGEVAEIDEGELVMSRCVNCGHRVERALRRSHHLKRVAPLLDGPRDTDRPHRTPPSERRSL